MNEIPTHRRGIFVSDWTTDGDLYGVYALYNPMYIFYREGLFQNRQWRFDRNDRLKDLTAIKTPVYILQPHGNDELIMQIIHDMKYPQGTLVVIDVELDMNHLVRRTEWLITQILENTDCRPMLYVNPDFVNRYRMRQSQVLHSTLLWLAWYRDNLPVFQWGADFAVWQRAPRLRYHNQLTLNVCDEVILNPDVFIFAE